MPTSHSPLKVAVLGAGKIGSTFAFQLARVGRHDVTVIARPGSARLEQLQRDSAIVDVKGERADVRVLSMLDEQTPYDLIIVTLLAHQTEPMLPTLTRSAAKCILFMFNTFHPERLQEAIGDERCCLGMPFVQAAMDGDGRIKATIGAGGQKTIMNAQTWVDVFNSAGLPAALEPNMSLWLRCHAPMCVAFESVSVAGERSGGGASWKEAMVVAGGVHASFELIAQLGHQIYPKTKQRIYSRPTWILAGMLWFVSRIRPFRELLATGEAECCALVDDMAAAASVANQPDIASTIQAMKPSN